MTISCKICDHTFSSQRRLCKHVRDAHKLTSQAYYDQQLRCEGEGTCKYCSSATKFESIALGYRSSCNSCKSQKAKDHRLAQKQNTDKHNAFVAKVKTNQTRIWNDRKGNGQDILIRNKIGQTIKSNNSNLTPQELADRYGWLNKLTSEDKHNWITEVMLQTGCHAWWKTATYQEKREVIHKRIATLSQTILEIVQQYHDDKDSFSKYCEAVNCITRINYFKFKDLIDPNSLRGDGHHLDHIFSKKAGFLQSIDPFIIGSRHNLRIIPAQENVRKSAKCAITIQELMEKYHEQV